MENGTRSHQIRGIELGGHGNGARPIVQGVVDLPRRWKLNNLALVGPAPPLAPLLLRLWTSLRVFRAQLDSGSRPKVHKPESNFRPLFPCA